MSDDWIGVSKPVISSAPPWPSDWRISWDPRAPHGKSNKADPPTLNPVPPSTPDAPITITGTGCPGGQVQLELKPGGYSVWFMVDASGTWTWTSSAPLPLGDYCARARQRCPAPDSGWSDWTAEECFSVIEITQTIDFEAKDLRYDSVNNWNVRGTLAFKINGVWTYGVLKRVV